MKTEKVLLQANIHQNGSKCSLKSSRHYSHKAKQTKQQNHNERHEKWASPKTIELSVSTNSRCNVGCQSCKFDVRNELCSIRLMSCNRIEVVMCMP